jgi:hypothetical protein
LRGKRFFLPNMKTLKRGGERAPVAASPGGPASVPLGSAVWLCGSDREPLARQP